MKKQSKKRSAIDERLDQRFEYAKMNSKLRSAGDCTQSREFYDTLDEYVREPVYLLQQHGILTHQSCQGGPGHSYDEPTIDFAARPIPGEGFKALAVLIEFGYKVTSLLRVYDVENAEVVESYWRITFRAKTPSVKLKSGYDLRKP